MALWFKKETPVKKQFSNELVALRKELDNLSPKIHSAKFSEGFKASKRALEIAKNMRVIAMGKIRNIEDLQKNIGAIEAYDDILALFEKMIIDEDQKLKKKEDKGVRKFVRNQSPAGASDWQ